MGDLAKVVKAYDVRGLVPDELDEPLTHELGAAFVEVLGIRATDGGPGEVVVGQDMRPSSPGLADAFTRGVTGAGVDVVRLGLTSTDQLYFAAGRFDRPGAMFTASHNPARYNGIKLCRAGASPVGADTGLAQVQALVAAGVPAYDGPPGSVADRDVLAAYAGHLHDLADVRGDRPITVVVDAGNGMAGHTAPAVIGALDGVTMVPMYFELDGSFPHHEANPIDPANLVDLQRQVTAGGADLGLAFDGDADRCFVVDERGAAVPPALLTALIAERELRRVPGAAVIHNLVTGRVVPEVVVEHGGTPVRTRVGHSYIKAQMAATGAVFGGEHSGHFYFRDFWRADSGMLAALHVLAAMRAADAETTVSALLAPYDRYVASGELNSTVADPAAVTARVHEAFAARPGVSVDHLDGMTVEHADWWFNLRPSNTEPLLRLNAEAVDRATMQRVRDEVLDLVRQAATTSPAAGTATPRPPR